MRIKMRCSYQVFAKKHLTAFRQRLENAGYPNWFISKHFQKGHARYEGLVRQAAEGVRDLYRDRKSRRPAGECKIKAPPGDQVLWIPRVSNKFLSEIKSAVRASRLKLQVKERAGISLRRMLAHVPKAKPFNMPIEEIFEEELIARETEDLTQFNYKNKIIKNKVVLVTGNFNVLHPGHMRLLRFAQGCGDRLLSGR